MNSKESSFYNKPSSDEIGLAELWSAIWSSKLLIIMITFTFAVSSIVYAIKQPDIYKASILLAPTSEQGGAGGLAKMAGQFGGLASLAGINLGGGINNKVGLALEVLQSRIFIENFIEKHELLVPLIAAKGWNYNTRQLKIDTEVFDKNKNEWIREVVYPKTMIPSGWEVYKAFKEKLEVSKNEESGMITISIEHFSPDVAKKWLTWLVEDLNNTIRRQDKDEAQNSVEFLSNKLKETQVADMQVVFHQLIEEQTKTIMLAEVSKEYVLKTIDPANAPDEKAKPKRALIVILITFLGGFLSVMFVLIRYIVAR